MKEKFLCGEQQSLNLLQYVSNFRTRLTKVCEIARQNLEQSQTLMKTRHDKKAFRRTFTSGDKVLAVSPIPGNPLRPRYFGPYEVKETNYVLVTPDRHKANQLCHTNMLKLYHE